MWILAEVPDCGELPELADEIHDLRDQNAELGMARAEAVLERLSLSDRQCPEGELLMLRALASNLHILGHYREGLLHIEKALGLLEQLPAMSPEHRASLHLTAGVLHWDLEAHDQAISHYLQALEASEEAGDVITAARAAGNIGNLYNTTGQYQRARQHHQRALSGFEQAGWPVGVAGTLVNLAALAGRLAHEANLIGDEESEREEYQHMLEVGQQALMHFEQLENLRGVAHAATNVATALSGLNRGEEAIDYIQRALELHREVGDRHGELHSRLALAEAYQALGEFDKADELLSRAAGQVPEDNLAQAYTIAERRVALAEARSDFRSALEHQRTLTSLRRMIADNQMAARVEEVLLAMQAEQREQELALLRSEAEINELELTRQRILMLVALLMASLFLALLALVFWLWRSRVKRSRQLDLVARTDPLTGLSNRRDMMDRLKAAHRGCLEDGAIHGLILADLDDFKRINDRHGHAVGDEVLVHLAELLSKSVKGQDVVARWGGEEFLVLLPQTELTGAQAVAENLRLAVQDTPFPSSVGDFVLTVTIGVSELSGGVSVDEAIQRADAAMYQGKEAGKNRFVVHS